MISFSVSRLPELHFGVGMIRRISGILRIRGAATAVFITGERSFRESQHWADLRTSLSEGAIDYLAFTVAGEPQPVLVDEMKREIGDRKIDAVVSIGGGSVIDAGKALSAALRLSGSIRDYLEGVGTKKPDGEKEFFIAAPTTSGTGSEATKNAVLSEIGEHGFKKSLRHDNYVPDVAIVDPSLVVGCPQFVTARSGMDAITQLLEAYASTEANPYTDAIAESGLQAAGRSFLAAYADGDDIAARSDMAYAAYASGVCLANAGLGVVHGIASPAGAVSSIPHGAVCGTLIAEATRYTIEKLRSSRKEHAVMRKYARAAVLLTGEDRNEIEANLDLLVDRLYQLQEEVDMPRLGRYALSEEQLSAIAERAGTKNHPVDLDSDDIRAILDARL